MVKWSCLLLRLKSRSTRGASHHTAFMDNWQTINHTFLVLPTQCVSSPCSAIDSITQTEESKIGYDYVIMIRNIKFKYTVEKLQTTLC